MTCCAVCREPIELSRYGWTLIARGEHIDDGRACLDGAVHAPDGEEIPGSGRKKRPVWLDELDPDRGDFGADQPPDCSITCAIAQVEIGATS